MEAIEIKPDLMPFLCQKAEDEGKSITEVLDELLRLMLAHGHIQNTANLRCRSCKHEVDYQINEYKAYCEYCESVVFFDKC